MEKYLVEKIKELKGYYRYVDVKISADLEDALIAELWEFPLLGIIIEEILSSSINIRIFPENEEDVAAISSQVRSLFSNRVTIIVGMEVSAEWSNKLYGWFEPVKFHDLEISPFSPGQKQGIDGRTIYIYSGRGYGTGNHATTSMCIQLLKKYLTPGTRVLDYGTGSGVLSIAAFKWGAASLVAIDNDPDAVENASINFGINGVEKHSKLLCGSVVQVPSEKFKLIVANLNSWIIAGIMNEGLAKLLDAGGVMILSGIRIDHIEDISRVLAANYLEEVEWRREDKWTTVVVKKGKR